ncbi:hypothetical protein DITRI_Ditri02bG0063100 [Diplodiscus trichospermus]
MPSLWVGDANSPRPWSRYRLKKQENVTETGKIAAGTKSSCVIDFRGGKRVLENSENDDPQPQEFLQEGRHTLATVDVDADETNVALDDDETKESKNLALDEVISDMDYFKNRVKKDWSDSESDDNEENDDGDQKEKQLSENVIRYQIQEGPSKDAEECAVRALEEADKSMFQGRLLHVMPAKLEKKQQANKRKQTDDYANQGSKFFKQKSEEERKASEASGDTRAWNSLFMRPDTVAESITRKYGVRVSCLDQEADDLAVRIALGEAQVIAETKKALENAGVNISFLGEVAAGKTNGMNLPYGSSYQRMNLPYGE